MKVQLFIIILFSFFTQLAFAQYYNPTEKEWKKVDEEFKKGKSKTFEKLLKKGLHPYSQSQIWKNQKQIYVAASWESMYPVNEVGYRSFFKLAELGFDPNMEFGTFGPGTDNETRIRTLIQECSTQTFKYFVAKGADYKRTWRVEFGEVASLLTFVFNEFPYKGCDNEDLKEAIQTAIDYGVDICADGGKWMTRPKEPGRSDVINYFYNKYKDEASCF